GLVPVPLGRPLSFQIAENVICILPNLVSQPAKLGVTGRRDVCKASHATVGILQLLAGFLDSTVFEMRSYFLKTSRATACTREPRHGPSRATTCRGEPQTAESLLGVLLESRHEANTHVYHAADRRGSEAIRSGAIA